MQLAVAEHAIDLSGAISVLLSISRGGYSCPSLPPEVRCAAEGGTPAQAYLVDTLASSLARALGRYYHIAGRLAVEEHSDRTITIPLRITGEAAELVHAAAPGVAVADIVGSVYTPSSVVWAFFPLNGLRGADAAIVSLLVLWAQVTELADGIFIGMSMNHSVGNGTSFWELFNAWSAINRGDKLMGEMVSTPARVRRRWFVDTSPVPIPFPFSTLQHVVQRFELAPVREGFFTFSAASVKKLKARANDEMARGAAISSLRALLAHLWPAVSRARRMSYYLVQVMLKLKYVIQEHFPTHFV